MEETIKDKIHRYLREDMSDEEFALFEAEMQINPELGELVENERQFLTAIYQIARGEEGVPDSPELAKSKEILKQIRQKHRSSRRIKQYSIAGAAVVAILATIYILFWVNRPSNTELYAKYYHPLGGLTKVIGADMISHIDTIDKLVNLYETGDYTTYLSNYKQAQSALDSTTSNYTLQKDVLNLYAGLCYMETEQHQQAVEVLQLIPESSVVYDESLWYAALGCLKENDVRGAQESLNKIKVGGGVYRDSAETLYRRIN